jgi:hypothetical protein
MRTALIARMLSTTCAQAAELTERELLNVKLLSECIPAAPDTPPFELLQRTPMCGGQLWMAAVLGPLLKPEFAFCMPDLDFVGMMKALPSGEITVPILHSKWPCPTRSTPRR